MNDVPNPMHDPSISDIDAPDIEVFKLIFFAIFVMSFVAGTWLRRWRENKRKNNWRFSKE